jgi:pimeloyl-ACP methyl ester carboxylesterase
LASPSDLIVFGGNKSRLSVSYLSAQRFAPIEGAAMVWTNNGGGMHVIQGEQQEIVSTRQYRIKTSHGSLAVEETGHGEIPLLMIHGNSFCRGVFHHQLQSSLAANHRLIAFDLPGTGQSSNAPDPEWTYTLPGLADTAIELLLELEIPNAIVFGWSLGGHVGVEMISRYPGLRGLMISGAPPAGRDQMAQAFKPSPQMALAGKQDFSPTDVDTFVQGIFGEWAEPFMRDAVVRADGRLRKRLFASLGARPGPDPRQIVEKSPTPLAVVNGGADPIVNLDYFDSIKYANLWEKHCHRLAGLGHAPFWGAPGDFNPLLERFLADVESGRAGR